MPKMVETAINCNVFSNCVCDVKIISNGRMTEIQGSGQKYYRDSFLHERDLF